MFCNQCEQTAKGTGCTVAGVCGKKPDVAALQDLLTYILRGLSGVALKAGDKGIVDSEVNRLIMEGLFVTLTNVNFDDEDIAVYINRVAQLRDALAAKLDENDRSELQKDPSYEFVPDQTLSGLVSQGEKVGHLGFAEDDPDIKSLKQLLVYGLRGVSAYGYHAFLLGQEDGEVHRFIQRAMTSLVDESLEMNDRLALVLECGQINLRAMELLDAGNTGNFGHPQPTPVNLGHRKGKCILVSGHDLIDLKELLVQTEGKGINIYTHGEMLPAHGYPELHKHPHLTGHFGTAWQNQKKEFAQFPGAILMTTNCIQEPQAGYFDNIFTTGPVGWPGVTYVENGAFEKVIEKALDMPGFASDEEGQTILTGFAHDAVLNVAPQVIEAVKSGDIKHFILVGGCDGAKAGRNYFTEIVEKSPADTVILTLGCGKYRFFDKELGDIGGIPRLLDIGQCNDAYSAVQIALALADAFECGVNDLPLSLVLSWYEQKAVAVLLSLLALDIKDIRLGPSLPAFVSPTVLKVLVDNFGVRPIGEAEADLQEILAG
ncbi:MAG: hydroxylamine reductase [Syntrophomonadaceae bacterium]|nr:hydroxylamine reductase [Syntrophomonadaceae bacterium]